MLLQCCHTTGIVGLSWDYGWWGALDQRKACSFIVHWAAKLKRLLLRYVKNVKSSCRTQSLPQRNFVQALGYIIIGQASSFCCEWFRKRTLIRYFTQFIFNHGIIIGGKALVFIRALFLNNNFPPNQPISRDHIGIDWPHHIGACLFKNLDNSIKEGSSDCHFMIHQCLLKLITLQFIKKTANGRRGQYARMSGLYSNGCSDEVTLFVRTPWNLSCNRRWCSLECRLPSLVLLASTVRTVKIISRLFLYFLLWIFIF